MKRLGLTMHVGQGGKKSKTEAMPLNGDGAEGVSPFDVADGSVHFVEDFKHLGSYVPSNLSDARDVEHRITQAGAAFGALRKCLFGARNVPHLHKGDRVCGAHSCYSSVWL